MSASPPHFPYPMPLVVPPSIKPTENDNNNNNPPMKETNFGPVIIRCTFCVPSPG